MNVLSLFDGIGCGMLALRRAGITIDNYFASEVDTYAIKVARTNYPQIVEMGDIQNIEYKYGLLTNHYHAYPVNIDIIIGGSPCQGFSFAGKQLNFNDPRSKLFFEYVRLIQEIKPKYFLLENVTMQKKYSDVITQHLGVEPILLNSALTSAAIRRRLYWTNIPNVSEPEDQHITFGDIREREVQQSNMYYSDKALEWIRNHAQRTNKVFKIMHDDDKMQTLEASMYKKYSSQRFFGIQDTHGLRYITPLECERCMNLPDNYTSCCSDTQRYKQLGNGWEVNMLAHIFKNLKGE